MGQCIDVHFQPNRQRGFGAHSRTDPAKIRSLDASLIPPAFGLGGVNLHTWIGCGSVPHWNAFVANLEMHGKGRFFDPRLNFL